MPDGFSDAKWNEEDMIWLSPRELALGLTFIRHCIECKDRDVVLIVKPEHEAELLALAEKLENELKSRLEE